MGRIVEVLNNESQKWDEAISEMSGVTSYHYWAFAKAVQMTYGQKPIRYALVNKENGVFYATVTIFEFKPMPFKKDIVSLPFCDYGGILAKDEKSEKELLAFLLKKYHNLPVILRQLKPLDCQGYSHTVNSEKVRMRFKLELGVDELMKSFKAKLRAQIRRPEKDGCTAVFGREELLDDFYEVFLYNMRDLGSPVHSVTLMKNMLMQFDEKASLFVVYSKEKKPIACSMVLGAGDTLINPWASSDRRYQKLAPNMLLYWEMIKYAINNGYKYFDFGRSTEGEGTYRFKKQWGAQPEPMYWYEFSKKVMPDKVEEGKSWKKELFIKVWQKMPIAVTRIVGPKIRKMIHL